MAVRAASCEEAASLVRAGARYAAGRTVLRVGTAPEEGLVDISGLPGLGQIDEADGGSALRIGALVTLERLRRDSRLVARNPCLASLLGLVAGLGVRTLATLGGNLGWGAGDLTPALSAGGATLETSEGECEPHALPAGALVFAARLPAEPAIAFAEKVGYRAAFSPSLITVACGVGLEGGRLRSARIAAGAGMTAPQRLHQAEALLEGASPGRVDFALLSSAIRGELRTHDDAFASAAHRRMVAARVICGRLREQLHDRV